MPRIAIALALSFALVIPCHLWAADPPKEPLLRIETGLHTAIVRQIATDGGGRYLVTAAEDKTLRVWETGSGRLLRTIRPPAGEGNEGKLYAVALSTDGTTIACGGWTALGSDRGYTIYLFNRATGTLSRRITGLTSSINHLAFTEDGRHLAASLGGSQGIRVFRLSDGGEAFRDSSFGSGSYGITFDRAGRLAAASYDGSVRLYDRSFAKVATVTAPGGKEPHGIAFSPDGSRIAVGYDDSSRVDVLSGKDLSLLFSADTTGVAKILSNVAWSADGRFLFAGGTYSKKVADRQTRMVRRWANSGLGEYVDLTAAYSLITSMAPLPDGRLAFGAAGPAFGILDRNGNRSLFIDSETADFRNKKSFRVAADGQGLAFDYDVRGKNSARFNLAERKLLAPELARSADTALPSGKKAKKAKQKQQDPPAEAVSTSAATLDLKGLEPPLTTLAGINVTDWHNTTTPKLNNTPLKLQQHENSRSLAILPDGSGFVLGADWKLRLFGPDGAERWKVPTPGTAWAVNVAWSVRLVVAAYGDGTIRWHRLSDGKELLAFFPHKDQKRWVLWTPGGYYDASPGGEELIGWHVNNGRDEAADFFPAARFRASYYRPDVIARIFDTLDEGESVRLANRESNRKQASASVTQALPPVVTITAPADGATVSSSSVTLRYSVRSPADAPITNLKVLIDGRPMEQSRGLQLKSKGGDESVTVTIPSRDCEVSLVAENRNSASVPASVRLTWAGTRKEEFIAQPKLYLLSVGVSAYRDPDLKLRYAAKDAKDVAEAFRRQQGGIYREVQAKVLADATKDDILDGLDWLTKETTSRDVAVIFLAGHGVNDPSGIFYYLPQNADPEKLKRTGVAFTDIKNTLASLAGKAVLFVDTCHSGNVMGTRRGVADINAVVNELSSAENGTVVFASSTGRQYSLEDEKWGNGAFTKALVEGLSGQADYQGKGKITINMLDLYLSERVKELTGGKQTPTTTKPATVPDFPLAVRP